jgi:hypothetical protein
MLRMDLLRWLASLSLSLCAATATAHHSFDGVFDRTKGVKLVGVITKVDWVNPHIYLYMAVPDKKGMVTTWRLESAPPSFWRRTGMTKEKFLSHGDTVIVNANPARRKSADHLGLFQKLTRTDGTYVQSDAFVAGEYQ